MICWELHLSISISPVLVAVVWQWIFWVLMEGLWIYLQPAPFAVESFDSPMTLSYYCCSSVHPDLPETDQHAVIEIDRIRFSRESPDPFGRCFGGFAAYSGWFVVVAVEGETDFRFSYKLEIFSVLVWLTPALAGRAPTIWVTTLGETAATVFCCWDCWLTWVPGRMLRIWTPGIMDDCTRFWFPCKRNQNKIRADLYFVKLKFKERKRRGFSLI